MPNQEILGGLRHALNQGESLEKAMLSFYNSGYRKEEIEEAARFIQQGGSPEGTAVSSFEESSLGEETHISVAQETKSIPVQLNPQSKISAYGQEKSKKLNPVKKAVKGLIIAIIVAAILFVGLLIAFLVTT